MSIIHDAIRSTLSGPEGTRTQAVLESVGLASFVSWLDVRKPAHPGSGRIKVYCLVDPVANDVRYVGVTSKSMVHRLAGHLQKPTNWRTAAWFRSLVSRGLRPRIYLLQRCEHDRWEICEMQWIAWFRARGDLLNIDGGGLLVDAGSGLEEMKRAKLDMLAVSAAANMGRDMPPPCAIRVRKGRDRRAEQERKQAMIARRKAQRKARKLPSGKTKIEQTMAARERQEGRVYRA